MKQHIPMNASYRLMCSVTKYDRVTYTQVDRDMLSVIKHETKKQHNSFGFMLHFSYAYVS